MVEFSLIFMIKGWKAEGQMRGGGEREWHLLDFYFQRLRSKVIVFFAMQKQIWALQTCTYF